VRVGVAQNPLHDPLIGTRFVEIGCDPATESVPPYQGSPTASTAGRDAIDLGLSRDRNAMAIWQDLVSEHGFRGGDQTVKRFVRKLRGNHLPQPRAVIFTAPGEEAQVDYGKGPMTREPQSGKYRRTRLFVMTRGCSRKAARFPTFRSSSRIWAELHEKAFRRFGGSQTAAPAERRHKKARHVSAGKRVGPDRGHS
jgi:hypothetical protein